MSGSALADVMAMLISPRRGVAKLSPSASNALTASLARGVMCRSASPANTRCPSLPHAHAGAADCKATSMVRTTTNKDRLGDLLRQGWKS